MILQVIFGKVVEQCCYAVIGVTLYGPQVLKNTQDCQYFDHDVIMTSLPKGFHPGKSYIIQNVFKAIQKYAFIIFEQLSETLCWTSGAFLP